MGYELTAEEAKKPYVEVSGRKGFGVKADDLLDKLEAATLAEVQQRHAEMEAEEQKFTAHAIAVGALRFFLLKFTRNAIIAFDFKDALSFEGETGPYCQYAVVRIRGIRRKGAEAGATNVEVTKESVSRLLEGAEGNSLWELLVAASALDRKSTRLNSSHGYISYAVFCLKKKKQNTTHTPAFAKTSSVISPIPSSRGTARHRLRA